VRGRHAVRGFVSLRWVPLAGALLALPLSAAALLVSIQQPEVVLIVPDQIRVAHGRTSGAAYVYLQPAFVSTGRNERVEVIRGMRLDAVPEAPTGPSAPFTWSQVLRLVTDPATGALNYQYEADAVPLLVGPRDAAAPLSLFDAPDGWFFTPGTYRFTLTADRVVTAQPLTGSFSLTLSSENIAFLDGSDTEQFLTLPISPQ
jgi:hypothetical protein